MKAVEVKNNITCITASTVLLDITSEDVSPCYSRIVCKSSKLSWWMRSSNVAAETAISRKPKPCPGAMSGCLYSTDISTWMNFSLLSLQGHRVALVETLVLRCRWACWDSEEVIQRLAKPVSLRTGKFSKNGEFLELISENLRAKFGPFQRPQGSVALYPASADSRSQSACT